MAMKQRWVRDLSVWLSKARNRASCRPAAAGTALWVEGRVLALSVLALAAGVAVYAFVRGPQTLFVAGLVDGGASLHGVRLSFADELLGSVAALPTAVHAFAFSLATAALLGRTRAAIGIACLFWITVDGGLEFLQAVPSCPPALREAESLVARAACAYISNGTFDCLDLASIAAGSAAAFLTFNRIAVIPHHRRVS